MLTKPLSFLAALVTLLQCLSGVSLDGLRSDWLATAFKVLPSFLTFLVALVELRQRVPSAGIISVLIKTLSFLAALVNLLQSLWMVSLAGPPSNWLATAFTLLSPILSFFAALVDLRPAEASPLAELTQLPAGSSRTRGAHRATRDEEQGAHHVIRARRSAVSGGFPSSPALLRRNGAGGRC